MANRVNKSGAGMGAAHLVGESIKTMGIRSLEKMTYDNDNIIIDKFKRQQSGLITRVCPAFGAAYHPSGDEYSLDNGGHQKWRLTRLPHRT